MSHVVYQFILPNGEFYIGMTKSIVSRQATHWYSSQKTNKKEGQTIKSKSIREQVKSMAEFRSMFKILFNGRWGECMMFESDKINNTFMSKLSLNMHNP